ncbi:hypothetical protein MKW92_009233 [Papaver armeniacum]|nr:hypothetical protein MKW92_009233 [Papaver armeniacum]
MELLLLLLSASCLLVGVVGNHAAALPSEIYWKNKLPNTPMPTILHELLHPVTDRIGILDNLYDVKYRPPLGKTTISNGENLNAAMNSPGASRFFLEKDLHPGAKMNLHFVVSTASGTTFLPQKLAKVTPFSSSKLPEILNQFNINPKSQKAESISQIIMVCEKPAMENEEKYCATSLESLVKYGTSKFGKNVNVFTTVIGGNKGKRTRAGKQQYVVGSGVRKIVSDNLVVCHSLPYPYAVFFCHATSAHTAQASVVPLVGADGTKIKATAVCHKDTSKWDPDHVAFQVLKASTDGAKSRNIYTPTRTHTIFEQANFQVYTKKQPSQLLNLSQPLQQFALSKYSPSLGKSTIPKDNAATNRQLMDSPGASLFFLEKDLYPGAKMNLHFVVGTPSGTTFLPKSLAEVTPFSSNKLPEILNQFAISQKSEEAELISQIIMDCEQPAIENEEKYCATSLESLVEYGTSKLGKNVNVLTTVILGDKGKRTRKQPYVVSSGVREIVSDNLVPCHSLPYLYAVFYCHETSAHTAQAYVVPLVGADGMKIKATAVCHQDTSKWDPDHVAFQVFKVKPGTVPICHFLTEDSIVWVAKNKDN